MLSQQPNQETQSLNMVFRLNNGTAHISTLPFRFCSHSIRQNISPWRSHFNTSLRRPFADIGDAALVFIRGRLGFSTSLTSVATHHFV